jgi:hypothetical protein
MATSSSDAGDISVRTIWIICIGLYAAFMLAATAFPHEMVWMGAGRLPGTNDPNWELGLAETIQNIFLAAALIMAGMVFTRAETLWMRVWFGVVFVGVLYLFGEEISWGQHYFRWVSGGWFAEYNDQSETNLHNTSALLDQLPRNVLYLGMVVGGIAHPLVKLWRKGRGLIDNPWWLAPTIACLPPVVFAFLSGAPKGLDKVLVDAGVEAWANGFRLEEFVGRASEMEECFMYFFFIVYLWSLGRRLKFRSANRG